MIQDNILAGIKDAMKAKDRDRLSVLRSIKTAFTNALVATNRTPQDTLSDEEALRVITKLAKQRKDSIQQFQDGGRPELAEKEATELAILEEFLPELMSQEDIEAFVTAKKDEMGLTDPSKKGMLIGAAMKELKGKADGSLVRQVVESLFE